MKLLIVDDDAILVAFLKNVAKSKGIEDVHTASSGEEALMLVVQNNYDFITLDNQMPGTSGLEILSMVRNMCPHAIIAIISGHVSEEMLPDISGCADLVIQKPLDLDVFKDLLAHVEYHIKNMIYIRSLSDLEIPLAEKQELDVLDIDLDSDELG